MNQTESRQQWFVVRVKPRHEKTVCSALRTKEYEGLLPLYRSKRRWADRLKDVELPLFPGYVFCRFDPLCRVPILNTPGVIDIVRAGAALAPVEEHEIEALHIMMEHGLSAEPWEFVHIGQTVTIQEGPLRGLSGIVLDFKRSMRLVLSVSLLQRSVLVEIDRDRVSHPEAVGIGPSRSHFIADVKAKAV